MANDFDIGKQGRLDIVSNGAVLDSRQVTGFMAKQDTNKLTSRKLGAPRVVKNLPDGWSGSFTIDRLGPTLDRYFAQAEDDYWNDVGEPEVFITQTVKEKDGSVSQFRYEDVSMVLEDAGNFEQEKQVPQKVTFEASRRRLVS